MQLGNVCSTICATESCEATDGNPSRYFFVVRTIIDDARRHHRAGISPHWLRHAHGSHAHQPGAPTATIRATLGPASLSTTDTLAPRRRQIEPLPAVLAVTATVLGSVDSSMTSRLNPRCRARRSKPCKRPTRARARNLHQGDFQKRWCSFAKQRPCRQTLRSATIRCALAPVNGHA